MGDENSEEKEYRKKALSFAEKNGIVEYFVNGRHVEYWTFYGQSEGWYFVRYDLDSEKEIFRGANIPWDGTLENPCPKFLVHHEGGLLYNYMQG